MKKTTSVLKVLLALTVLTVAVAPASAGHATDSPLNEDEGSVTDGLQEAVSDAIDGDDDSNDDDEEDAAEETTSEWLGF